MPPASWLRAGGRRPSVGHQDDGAAVALRRDRGHERAGRVARAASRPTPTGESPDRGERGRRRRADGRRASPRSSSVACSAPEAPSVSPVMDLIAVTGTAAPTTAAIAGAFARVERAAAAGRRDDRADVAGADARVSQRVGDRAREHAPAATARRHVHVRIEARCALPSDARRGSARPAPARSLRPRARGRRRPRPSRCRCARRRTAPRRPRRAVVGRRQPARAVEPVERLEADLLHAAGDQRRRRGRCESAAWRSRSRGARRRARRQSW